MKKTALKRKKKAVYGWVSRWDLEHYVKFRELHIQKQRDIFDGEWLREILDPIKVRIVVEYDWKEFKK